MTSHRNPKRGIALSAIAVLAGIAVAGIGAAFAQPGPGGGHGPPPHGPPNGAKCLPPHVKKLLPKYDANKNGRLDPDEHHAMHEAQRKADLAKYDKNGDGRLDKKEHEALRYDRMVEQFEELDTNRDAEISRAEAKGSCTPLEWGFDHVDADGNGSVTWTEFEKAAPKGPPPHHRGPPPPNQQP